MMSLIKLIALFLVIVSAINSGLVGLFDLNVLTKTFGVLPLLSKVFHVLVGFSGVLLLIYIKDYLK